VSVGGDPLMTPEEATALLERTGAMLSGHFRLSSGRHSDRYVEKARILQRPDEAMRLAREIASWYPEVDVVVAPAVGAVPLGFAVALAAGARSVYAEREGGTMTLRRGFEILPGERVLVVEDVVTTGRSAAEVLELVLRAGSTSLGVAALVDRSGAPPPFPVRAVLRLAAVSWDPESCPLCREGVPLEAPGSRHLSAAGEPSSDRPAGDRPA
jgi:orotate phosphoribosyltransferase